MTQGARIDRLEGMMERVVSDLSEIRQDMREMRTELRGMQAATDAKLRTILLVTVGLWGATVAAIVALALRVG